MSEESISDTLVVGVGSSSVSWNATIELDTGRCTAEYKPLTGPSRTWKSTFVEFTFDDDVLKRFAAWASEIHARGDTQYREQFAQAGVGISVTLDGTRVESQYHMDGGSLPDYDELFEIVRKRLFDAL